jgi:uncharacterized membrane protein (UPF0127 family)
MRAKLKFRGKEVLVEGIKKVSFIGKFSGLMFRSKNTRPLLFEFKKGKRAIHSFFCPIFLAIWLSDGKIVGFRLVKPFSLSVLPEKDFDKLIEIPFNNQYAHVVNFFIDGGKI